MATNFDKTYTGEIEKNETVEMYRLIGKLIANAKARGDMVAVVEMTDELRNWVEAKGETFLSLMLDEAVADAQRLSR